VAFVDMRVAVDETGQHDTAGKIDRAIRCRRPIMRCNARDLAIGDSDLDQRKAIPVMGRSEPRRQRCVKTGIGEPV
jgi:hypothetical protein